MKFKACIEAQGDAGFLLLLQSPLSFCVPMLLMCIILFDNLDVK